MSKFVPASTRPNHRKVVADRNKAGRRPPPAATTESTSTEPDIGPAAHRRVQQDLEVLQCGSYRPGHMLHFIQVRKSGQSGPGTPATVTRVDDDGTITFADGTTKWNHEPERLRAALERHGSGVFRGAFGVLRVPTGPGRFLCFCLGDEPTRCPGAAPPPKSIEDLVAQAKERGGWVISGPAFLRLPRRRENDRMSDAEQAWRSKSDEEVREGAQRLSEYTEEGRRVINSEMSRRALTPLPPAAVDPALVGIGGWLGWLRQRK
ncbi:MAG: hypothetical protein O3A25_09945 [Acidobacteria bacterium]|nr:hypothetical protein [Acidobacteriota bacterium]